jgi:hypothetical protein
LTIIVYPFFFQGLKLQAHIFSNTQAFILILVFLDEFLKVTKILKMKKMNEREHKNLHVQRTMWKSYGRNSLCWVCFCVNDNKDVDVKCQETIFFVTVVQFGFITLKFKQEKV